MTRKPKSGPGVKAAAGEHVNRVIVKFRDSVDFPYEDGVERRLIQDKLAPWDELASRFRGITLRRQFNSVSPARIDELVQRATALDADYDPPKLSNYYNVHLPTEADPAALAEALNNWKIVERAYVAPPPTPPPTAPPGVDPSDDPRRGNQGYLDPAPTGIDAEFVWPRAGGLGIPGGDGAGLKFVDMEQGWTLDHEDLAAVNITVISGDNKKFKGHGTAVLGQIAAVDNNLGGIGIAPGLRSARVVSQWRGDWVFDTSNAILSALADMAFGDVLLLEAENASGNLMPVETELAAFHMIRLGTALGVTIVEPAGNGAGDLDSYTDVNGDQVLNRGAAGFRDSGAIMVAAATSTVPHKPYPSTNYGSRIDCYAWGEDIDTAGDGGSGTGTTDYTTSFGETSGAAPIVAGAALLVQSMSEVNLGYRFNPLQVRNILSDPTTGTESAAPDTDRIGVMPDLRSIVESQVLALTPDIYARDHVGDTGNPHDGAISASPDIILQNVIVNDPQGAFGEGSGTEDINTLGSQAMAGQDNFIYVRLRNRGGVDAIDVEARVYWSEVSTLVTPDQWRPVGDTWIANVPSGDTLTVSDGITWSAANIPAAGHYCFIGLVGTAKDPAPKLPDLQNDWDLFRRLVRDNNNVTWRNFNVVANEPATADANYVELPFRSPGAPDRARRMELEVVARLPWGATAALEVPKKYLEALRRRPPFAVATRKDRVILPLNPHGSHRLGQALYPAKSRSELKLRIGIPREARHNSYQVYARQLFKDEELGRVTWLLVPRRSSKSTKGDA